MNETQTPADASALDDEQRSEPVPYEVPDLDSVSPDMIPTLLGSSCGPQAASEFPCSFT